MKPVQITIGFFVVLLQLGTSFPAFAQISQNNTQEIKQIPEHAIYEFYMRKVVFYEDLAQKKEKAKLNGSKLRAAIANELGISEAQHVILARISTQALADATTLDAQAAEIIKKAHSSYIGVKLSKVPAPPPELAKLQTSRNLIFINAKTRISQELDAAAFQQIDIRIKAIVTPKINVKLPHQ
jgi:hypothetical protein